MWKKGIFATMATAIICVERFHSTWQFVPLLQFLLKKEEKRRREEKRIPSVVKVYCAQLHQ
jgi:hypothetical protein